MVISRITDAFLACPFLIVKIALAAFLGPSLTNAMIAIGVSATPIFVRLMRAQVLNVGVKDYREELRGSDAVDGGVVRVGYFLVGIGVQLAGEWVEDAPDPREGEEMKGGVRSH
ncbi:MAG TPA: hypothetical protein VFR86_16395 [Burkholderiaceae bacterium]|nr:hypothetical protein [Burkholderiaceae bacterium]